MTDNLLETASGDTETSTPEPSGNETSPPNDALSPPDGLPEKFWDADNGQLRTDSLVKSYLSLEQKLGALAGRGVPDSADSYDIKMDDALFASDPEINAKLHASGFSQDQAQAVYDLAAEYMSPMVFDVAAEFQAQGQINRLVEKFGGEKKWQETAGQLKQWGSKKFPDDVFQALSSTYEGVLTLHKMMDSGEPGLMEGAGAVNDHTSEASLQQMMQSPRYWRDHDPATVERVRDGFRRLFPE